MNDTEWIVGRRIGAPNGVDIRVVTGEPRLGEEVTCIETGSRYRVVGGVALSGPVAHAAGHRHVDLEWIDGPSIMPLPPEGAHLVRIKGDANAPGEVSPFPRGDQAMAEVVAACAEGVRSQIIIADSGDMLPERLGSSIVFVYDKAGDSWLSSARVLFRAMSDLGAPVSVFVIQDHLIPPQFVESVLNRSVPRGRRGEAIWFLHGVVHGRLARCTDRDAEVIRRFTEDLVRT